MSTAAETGGIGRAERRSAARALATRTGERFGRIGIQTRIMLYVTVGLAAMFGGFAYLGFQAVGDATRLVYEERLSTAYTTASIIERDFMHVARDADEFYANVDLTSPERRSAATARLHAHLGRTDPFPFFRVTGAWLVTDADRTAAWSGEPSVGSSAQVDTLLAASVRMGSEHYAVIPAVSEVSDGVTFATILVRVQRERDAGAAYVAVHTISVNSPADYAPTTYWRVTGSDAADGSTAQMRYHLEVVDPRGIAVLGVGADEHAGVPSRHLPAIGEIMARGSSAVVIHDPSDGQRFSPHAMAVVPLEASGFYLVLEQPTDVALSLPLDLGRSVGLVSVLGFLAAMVVAWITTRHVTGPTEQLTVAARRMARGHLESPIRVRAQDEVATLVENLDVMRRHPLYRRCAVLLLIALVAVALTLVTIGTRSPYTHANLAGAFDPRYDRTPQALLGEVVQLAALGPDPRRGAGGASERGAVLYVTQGCASCHALEARGGVVGPTLVGVDEETIAQRVWQGPLGMPRFSATSLTEDEIADIAAYLLSLGD